MKMSDDEFPDLTEEDLASVFDPDFDVPIVGQAEFDPSDLEGED